MSKVATKIVRAKAKHVTHTTTGGVAAVNRALSILAVFREGEASISLAELANRTGLYKSTILRLIGSLEGYGYIRRLHSGEYQLGPTLLRLSSLYQQAFRLEDYVLPALRNLVDQTKESGSFYVADGNKRQCLFRVDSLQAVRDHVKPGDLLPLDKGAAGRILTTFSRGLPQSLTTKPKFIVATFGERQPDTAAVACPVFGNGNVLVGALNISGPRTRFTKDVAYRIGKMVAESAKALTEQLGGNSTAYSQS